MILPKGRYIAIDTEGDTFPKRKLGPRMPWDGGECFILSFCTDKGENDAFEITPKTLPFIRKIMASDWYIKIFQHALYDVVMLRARGCPLRGPWHDTLPMSHLLDEFGDHSLPALARKWAGRSVEWKDAPWDWIKANRGSTMRDVPRDIIIPYAKQDARETLIVFFAIWPMVQRDFLKLYTLERQVILAAARMEARGVCIDLQFCKREIDRLRGEAKKATDTIYRAVGYEFNINSTAQLGKALEGLGVRLTEKTKPSTRFPEGQWSFTAEVLAKYAARGLKIAQEIEVAKLCDKLIVTYLEKFLTAKDTKDGRLHPSINTIGREDETVVSGRSSISKPSLQNLAKPKNKREESLIQVRKGIIAAPGYTLVKADYDQEEYKLAAEFAFTLAGDETLVLHYERNPTADFHRLVTSIVYQIVLESIAKDDYRRDICKTINFAILYGAMERKIAEELTKRTGRVWTVAETRQILMRYEAALPAIKRLMHACQREIYRQGFIQDVFGRRYRLEREEAYMATNRLIQGTAASVLKLATVRVNSRILKERLDAHILFPVHDELVLEIRTPSVAYVATKILRPEMTRDLPFRVPLTVSISEMKNYHEKRREIE